jgi:Family of unknown function (DUF5771)
MVFGLAKRIKHKGSLRRLGYKEHESAEKRRRALRKAVNRYGLKKTEAKLTAVQVLSENTNPEFSRTLQSDKNWLRANYSRESMRSR